MEKEKKDDVLYMDINDLFKGEEIGMSIMNDNKKEEKENVIPEKSERK